MDELAEIQLREALDSLIALGLAEIVSDCGEAKVRLGSAFAPASADLETPRA